MVCAGNLAGLNIVLTVMIEVSGASSRNMGSRSIATYMAFISLPSRSKLQMQAQGLFQRACRTTRHRPRLSRLAMVSVSEMSMIWIFGLSNPFMYQKSGLFEKPSIC